MRIYHKHVKKYADIIASYLLLLLLLPILIIITIFSAISLKGNPFFIQKRPGFMCKNIMLIKFRTMSNLKDSEGNLLPDSKRITKLGKILRNYSLDEIPQLLNVLKGDMSLVGPRPLLVKYIPLYNERQIRRHEVKPGMTGWAQVNGRNAISWKEKFEHDVWYVDNLSFLLDMKILYLTLKKVIKREGISSANSVTTEAFNGNN